jgi:hypothetical protein
MEESIPYATVDRLLRRHIPISMSGDYVAGVKQVLDEYVSMLAEASICGFDDINKLRRFHCLKPLRRMNIEALQNAQKYLNQHKLNFCVDVEDNHNEDTPHSEAGDRNEST